MALSEGMQYHVELNAGHYIYSAHFPGQPITPGVCIVQMARELIEHSVNKPLVVRSIKTAKFLSIVNPVDTPELLFNVALSYSKDDGTDSIGAKVEVGWGNAIFAKLTFELISR